MIAFEPLDRETRIALPDAVGPVVHARVRRFLTKAADRYLAMAAEECGRTTAGRRATTTIYDVNGLTSIALEELAGIIFTNCDAAQLYVRLPNGVTGNLTRDSISAESCA